MTLAEKIRQLRKAYHMTQEDLAEKLSVSRQTVSKWESGITQPDLSNIVEIGKLFQVSTDYLLKESETLIQDADKRQQSRVQKHWGILVLLCGTVSLVLFALMIVTGTVDRTSSMVTVNAYGIFAFLCLMMTVITVIVIIIKKRK